MAKDANNDYYYEAGTVNEIFDDIALVEGDDELEVETPSGVSALGGLATTLGGVRGSSMGTDDLASGKAAIYVYDNGSDLIVEVAYNNGTSVLTQTLATFTGEGGL